MSAITAKALNGTLGTGDFKSFDERLEEIVTNAFQKHLIVSSDKKIFAFHPYNNGEYIHSPTGQSYSNFPKVKMRCAGSVKLAFALTSYGLITLYKNGKAIMQKKGVSNPFGEAEAGERDVIAHILSKTSSQYVFNVKSGDELSIVVDGGGSTMGWTLYGAYLFGDVIDYSPIEII